MPKRILSQCDVSSKIVPASLSAVPASLKEAWVTPILKKPSLDPENFKNFRPISNLPFLAKTLEKVVLSQLQDHVNDLLLAADDGQVGCLVLLDLSVAFDKIDRHILLQKLFTVYTADLREIIKKHGLSYHMYVTI